MFIISYIFSFTSFGKKRGNDGRTVGAAHVLFSLLIHLLLVSEIVQLLSESNMTNLRNFGQSARNRTIYFLLAIPLWIAFWSFYNPERTKRLLKEYHQKYEKTISKTHLTVLLYFVLPILLVITLAIIRQQK